MRRVLEPLQVTYVWAYDTLAILPEYDDSEGDVLPAGALISESERQQHHVLCDLKDRKIIEKNQLPKKRIFRFFPWCFATPLQAVIRNEDFETKTEPVENPIQKAGLFRWLTSR